MRGAADGFLLVEGARGPADHGCSACATGCGVLLRSATGCGSCGETAWAREACCETCRARWARWTRRARWALGLVIERGGLWGLRRNGTSATGCGVLLRNGATRAGCAGEPLYLPAVESAPRVTRMRLRPGTVPGRYGLPVRTCSTARKTGPRICIEPSCADGYMRMRLLVWSALVLPPRGNGNPLCLLKTP